MGSLLFREEQWFSNLASGACTARCNLGILINLLVSAAAIPVSSALLMVFVILTPPEST